MNYNRKVFAAGTTVFLCSFFIFLGTLSLTSRSKDEYFLGYDSPDYYEGLTTGQLNQRHALSFLLTKYAVRGAAFALRISELDALKIALALFAAADVLLMFIALLMFKNGVWASGLFTFFYMFSFSTFTVYSFPESYVMTNMLILAYTIALIYMADKITPLKNTALSVMAAAAALNNAPLMSLFAQNTYIFYKKMTDKKKFLLNSLLSLALIVLIFSGFHYLYQNGPKFAVALLNAGTSSLKHLADPWCLKNDFVCFILFSVIPPMGVMGQCMFIHDAAYYLTKPDLMLLVGVYTVFFIYVCFKLLGPRPPVINAFLIWLGIIYATYVYFCPFEAFTYSSQTIIPITLIYAYAFTSMKFKYKYHAAVAFVFLLALNNFDCFYRALM